MSPLDSIISVRFYNFPEGALSAFRESSAYQSLHGAVKSAGGGIATLFVDGNDGYGRPGSPSLHVRFNSDHNEAALVQDSWRTFVRWLAQFQVVAPVFIWEEQSGTVQQCVSRRGMVKSLAEVYGLLDESDQALLGWLTEKDKNEQLLNHQNHFAYSNALGFAYGLKEPE